MRVIVVDTGSDQGTDTRDCPFFRNPLRNCRWLIVGRAIRKEIIILKLREFMAINYAPVETHTYTAYAQSKNGEALLKRCGFSMAVLAQDHEQRFPLYVLRPGETVAAV